MGSGTTRPNNADDKMIAAMERGVQDGFKDRNPPKNMDEKLIKAKEARAAEGRKKAQALRALRLAAEKEGKEK